ncbi:MAG: DUF2179 domain-containing protein [Oscillospiraceae bacterium]|nr:DUF2179 domain-containing protein [Oscillospiraceae bacterium]
MTLSLFLLCLRIFFSRILDVSLATVRTMLTVKGKTKTAALVGFVEIMIWFLAVRTAFNSDEAGIVLAIAYAGGFATGTFIGGLLSSKLIKGTVTVEIVTSGKDDNLITAIRNAGFAVTVVNVNSSEYSGEKYMLFAQIASDRLEEFKKLVYDNDDKAFIIVQESKYVYNGFIK